MLPIILLALLAAIVVAKLCPRAALSRTILKAFVDGPAQWLERPRPMQAVPYAIGIVVLTLVIMAAPELSMLATGLDIQLMVDLTLAASVALAQVGLRRVRIMAHKAIRTVTTPRRINRRKSRIRRARRSRTGTDDSDTAPSLMFV